jgi:hypothetical protein
MTLIARILGLSLLTGGMWAVFGFVFFRQYSDWSGIALMLSCVGAIIGAIAGAAREIANRPQRKHSG